MVYLVRSLCFYLMDHVCQPQMKYAGLLIMFLIGFMLSTDHIRYLYVKNCGDIVPWEQALLDYWFEWETISLKVINM